MVLKGVYTWSEKSDSLKIVIPLKGVSAKSVDIQVTKLTLKVNYSPWLVDVVLSDEINETKHSAKVTNGELHITLFKRVSHIWGTLEASGDKDELSAIKRESLLSNALLNETLSTQRADKKIAEEKHSLRKQMKLDETERNRVENLKQDEKEAAEKEVYETFKQFQKQEDQTNKGKMNASIASDSKDKNIFSSSDTHLVDKYLLTDDIDDFVVVDDLETSEDNVVNSSQSETTPTVFKAPSVELVTDSKMETDKSDIFSATDIQEAYTSQKEEEEVRYIPPPRVFPNRVQYEEGVIEAGADKKVVDIKFTHRVFPTPMRESKASEEEDWVARNRKHLKKHGVLGKNNTGGTEGDVSESDPVWLKAKGDDFYRYSDFRSAINAYSAAIDADEQMTACYSNRSACYLQLNMYHECKEDCLVAINQLTTYKDEVGFCANNTPKYSSIIKLYMRVAAVECHLGQFAEALSMYRIVQNKFFCLRDHLQKKTGDDSELSVLLKGVTEDSVAADIARLELLETADALKKEADLLFSDQQTLEAIAKYTDALNLIPFHVSCLSNRSACRMTLRDLKGCIEDCSTAISLLLNSDSSSPGNINTTANKTQSASQSSADQNMLNSILPPVGSDKRRTWVIKTLLRRGMASAQLATGNCESQLVMLQLLDSAVNDYAQASALDPSNETLRTDLNKLKTFREGKKLSVNQQ